MIGIILVHMIKLVNYVYYMLSELVLLHSVSNLVDFYSKILLMLAKFLFSLKVTVIREIKELKIYNNIQVQPLTYVVKSSVV